MFYTNYVKLCNSINQSPSSVSETLGFKRSVVTRWKNGSVPRQATLQKIADYFHVTVDSLLLPLDIKNGHAPNIEDIPIQDVIQKLLALNDENRAIALAQLDFLLDRQEKQDT